MVLWIILTFMVALAVSGITFATVRQREAERSRATTASILAARLADVDSQLAAGDLSPAEATPPKTEMRRRILAESHEPEAKGKPVPARAVPHLAIGIAGVVALAATGLYALLGRPDLAASAHVQTQSMGGATATKTHPGGDISAMIAQLEAKMRETPNYPEGWRVLGWSYLVNGRAADAATAYARAVALVPHNADYRSSQGEALVRAADGQVTPSALDAFHSDLKENAGDPRAKYYLALYKDQTGNHDGAVADWIVLIKDAPADAPWLPDVRRFVENVARQRGLNISANAAPGTASGDRKRKGSVNREGAGRESDAGADRQAMIPGMVDRLAGELKANPKNVEGWNASCAHAWCSAKRPRRRRRIATPALPSQVHRTKPGCAILPARWACRARNWNLAVQ